MSNELTMSNHWDVTKKKARAFLMSGYLREEYTRGVSDQEALAKVVTIISMGEEIDIGPLQALRTINIVQGRPAFAAELMLALCFKKIPGFKATFITPPEKSHEECTVVMQRPGGDPSTFRFTMEEAKVAGLVKPGGGWVKYAPDMLRARVTSRGCRAVAPDATLGVMSLEELGREVIDGEVSTLPMDPKPEIETSPVKTEIAPRKDVGHESQNSNTPAYNERYAKKMAEPCTEPQRKKLFAMSKSLGWSESEVKEWIFNKFGKESTKDLTKDEINNFFTYLDECYEKSTATTMSDDAEAGVAK